MAVGKENYFWHKLHSLTGIIPVGYYMVQHLTLNTFSLGGPNYFNGVISFFEGMPGHFLYALKILAIWLPLIFHAIYGLFITGRATPNYSEKAYQFRENRMFTFQRLTGIVAFLFLIYHMGTTSAAATITGNHELIRYAAWQEKLTAPVLGVPYLLLVVYGVGVAACTYHFSYGIWNFCIRWGITISERSQMRMVKFSQGAFVALTLLGWAALAGFLMHPTAPEAATAESSQAVQVTMSR